MKSVVVIVLICVVNIVVAHEDHSDEGTCVSPIDLNRKAATCGEGAVAPVANFGGAFIGDISNNVYGSFVLVKIPPEASETMSVKIGDKDYEVLDFHFHMGKDSTQEGSQHTEDEKHHELEMHITTGTDHVAALTFFVDSREGEDNSAFLPLTNDLKNAEEGGTRKVNVNLNEMVSEAIKGAFYQYDGGHIGPPCVEKVLWTIYETPLLISKAQMATIRAAGGDPSPFRPIQPLDSVKDRKLYYSVC